MMPVYPHTAGRFKSFKPAACYQMSRTERYCSMCGQRPAFVHLPTRYVGYFCAQCCPACRDMPAAKVE